MVRTRLAGEPGNRRQARGSQCFGWGYGRKNLPRISRMTTNGSDAVGRRAGKQTASSRESMLRMGLRQEEFATNFTNEHEWFGRGWQESRETDGKLAGVNASDGVAAGRSCHEFHE